MLSRMAPRDTWSLLATYLKPQRPRVLLLTLLVLASIGLQLASPLILRRFIDGALDGTALRTLLVIAAIYITAAIAIQLIRLAETWAAEYVGWTATNEMRADLAQHVLSLDMTFHNQHSPGTLIERVDGDVFLLGNFFSRFVIQVLGNGLLAIGVIVLLTRIDWQIGLVVALFSVLLVATMLVFGRFVAARFVESRRATADPDGPARRADFWHRGYPLRWRHRLHSPPQRRSAPRGLRHHGPLSATECLADGVLQPAECLWHGCGPRPGRLEVRTGRHHGRHRLRHFPVHPADLQPAGRTGPPTA
jgi:ABC-type multidrug transport system fused ATPase/permease subunit